MLTDCRCINYRDKIEIQIALEDKIKKAENAIRTSPKDTITYELALASKGDTERTLKKVKDTPDC